MTDRPTALASEPNKTSLELKFTESDSAYPKINGNEIKTIKTINLHVGAGDMPTAVIEVDLMDLLASLDSVTITPPDELIAFVDEAMSPMLAVDELRSWLAGSVVVALYRRAGLADLLSDPLFVAGPDEGSTES